MSHAYFLLFDSGIFGSMAFLLMAALFCFYFFPTIIAVLRSRHNAGAIFLLNLFLGWTLVGWVVALVWAVSSSLPPQQIIIHNSDSAQKSQPSPPAGSAQAPGKDKISQLQQLKQLMDDGVLTREEFDQQKARILAS